MGKVNDAMINYLKDKERFADFFNANLFEGRKVVVPEQLIDRSETYIEEYKEERIDGTDKNEDNKTRVKIKDSSTTRYRDIKMQHQSGGILRILALEDQTHVDYTMPWRHMNYDSLEYGNQLRDLKRKNKERGKFSSDAEKLCGILKTDRIIPTYTLCLYHGKEFWDGPRSLKDMMDFGNDREEWEEIFADYHFHLVCINEQTDFEEYHSSLKELFQLISMREDRQALVKLVRSNSAYQRLDEETVKAASVLLGDKRLMMKQNQNEEGTYNMCKALEDLFEEGRQEGKQEGKLEGKLEGLQEGKRSGIIAFLELCQEFGMNRETATERLAQKFGFEKSVAERNVAKYWK